MMRPSEGLSVFLCREVVDFRKGIDGLSAVVEGSLELNPFDRQLFVFCNRNRDKVKVLYWEDSGFCLWQKRLETDLFHWPERTPGQALNISSLELNWLLDGYDITRMKPHKKLHYSSVF